MNWDFYRVEREGHTEHVAWRVDLFQKAPDRSRPVRVEVALTLREPDEGGLPGEEEREALNALRDALEHDVVKATDGKYAARVTGAGRQVHVFYLPKTKGFFRKRGCEVVAAEVARELASEFPDHPLEVTHAEDEEWDRFLELFPSPDAVQWFRDIVTINELLVGGDDLSGPRALTHSLYFPTEAAREALVAQVAGDGFAVLDRFDASEDEPEQAFGLTLGRVEATLEPYVLHHRAVLPLVTATEALEGAYAGWEAAPRAGGDHDDAGDDDAGDDDASADDEAEATA